MALLLEERVEASDITAERIAGQPLVLLCAPDHPLAGREEPTTFHELAQESFFLHEQGCSYSDWLVERLQAVPGARPRLTRFGSIEAARSCVAAGLGLTLLPHANVAEPLRDGRLATVPGPPLPDVSVQLARHRRRQPSRAARAVAAQVVRHFGATPNGEGTRTAGPERPGGTGRPDRIARQRPNASPRPR
jgi:DNA-binding transcriptional LysR family regulator